MHEKHEGAWSYLESAHGSSCAGRVKDMTRTSSSHLHAATHEQLEGEGRRRLGSELHGAFRTDGKYPASCRSSESFRANRNTILQPVLHSFAHFLRCCFSSPSHIAKYLARFLSDELYMIAMVPLRIHSFLGGRHQFCMKPTQTSEKCMRLFVWSTAFFKILTRYPGSAHQTT